MNDLTRILMADDDPDDRLLVREAMDDARLPNPLEFVVDGQELMDRLRCQGKFAELAGAPLPDLILLDLNMPRKDGRECIKEIREDPSLRHLPIIVLTTSHADEDVLKTYRLGVNSFITKPATFDRLVKVMHSLAQYWFKVVKLPAYWKSARRGAKSIQTTGAHAAQQVG